MKLKTGEIIEIYSALLQLDGESISAKNNGADVVIKKPFKFSGKTRWNLAKDITILKKHSEKFNETRDNFIKSLSGGSNQIDQSDKTKLVEFQEQVNAELQKVEDVEGVLKIKIDELKLDENAISSNILSAISLILEE